METGSCMSFGGVPRTMLWDRCGIMWVEGINNDWESLLPIDSFDYMPLGRIPLGRVPLSRIL